MESQCVSGAVPQHLSIDESVRLSDALFITLYGHELWSRWRLLKYQLGFTEEHAFVSRILDIVEENQYQSDSNDGLMQNEDENQTDHYKLEEDDSLENNTNNVESYDTEEYAEEMPGPVLQEDNRGRSWQDDVVYQSGTYNSGNHDQTEQKHSVSQGFEWRNVPSSNNMSNTLRSAAERRPLGSSSLRCEQCGRQFVSVASMSRHVASAHEHVRHPCRYCGKSFTYRSNLSAHIKSVHQGVTYTCPSCHRAFTHRSNLSAHVKKCGGLVTSSPQRTRHPGTGLVYTGMRDTDIKLEPPNG